MVATGDDIDPGVNELLVDCLSDAESACCVLAVGDCEIEVPGTHQFRQALQYSRAPAPTHNVADEKNSHPVMPQDNE
jgi:hypothetical protein